MPEGDTAAVTSPSLHLISEDVDFQFYKDDPQHSGSHYELVRVCRTPGGSLVRATVRRYDAPENSHAGASLWDRAQGGWNTTVTSLPMWAWHPDTPSLDSRDADAVRAALGPLATERINRACAILDDRPPSTVVPVTAPTGALLAAYPDATRAQNAADVVNAKAGIRVADVGEPVGYDTSGAELLQFIEHSGVDIAE